MSLPKPPNKRVRRNAVEANWKSLQIVPGEQPPLPEREFGWSDMAQAFWEELGQTAAAEQFTALDWRILFVAAAAYEDILVRGNLIRTDQFLGVLGRYPLTPKDMQALRIQAVTGEEIESRTSERDLRFAGEQMKAMNKFESLRVGG